MALWWSWPINSPQSSKYHWISYFNTCGDVTTEPIQHNKLLKQGVDVRWVYWAVGLESLRISFKTLVVQRYSILGIRCIWLGRASTLHVPVEFYSDSVVNSGSYILQLEITLQLELLSVIIMNQEMSYSQMNSCCPAKFRSCLISDAQVWLLLLR